MKPRSWATIPAILVLLVVLAMAFPGCSAPSSVDANAIVLGLPTSMGYWFGTGAQEGAQLAIEEINKAGGVKLGGQMRPFKLEVIDTRDSAPGVPTEDSLRAIEKLILESKPVGIVCGPNRSEVLLAALDLFSKYKMVTIGCLAKTPALCQKVTDDYAKYKYFFHLTTDSSYMANYHIDLMKVLGDKYGVKTVYALGQDVLWAKGTNAIITDTLGKAGFKIAGNELFPLGTTDFSMALSKVKNASPALMPTQFDMPEVAQLMDQWATMKIPSISMGVIGPLLDRSIWKSSGGKVESSLLHICEAGVFPVKAIPKSVEFYNNYQKRWGKTPEGVAGQSPSYDAVYVFKAAIEAANSTEPDAMVAAMEKVDLRGAIGRITFQKNHQAPYGLDPNQGAIGVFVQWQQPGDLKLVFPTTVAETEIQLPPWMRK